MVSDAVKSFLNSNIIKDNPRMRSADFDLSQYENLSESEHQQIESILLSKLHAGHDARVLIALAELGTARAIEPLQRYIERIRAEGGISAEGLIYQACVALWRITRQPELVVPDFVALLHQARMGNARREVAVILAEIDAPEVRSALVSALDDPQGSVRKQVALSLAQSIGVTLSDEMQEAIRKGEADAIARLRQQAHSQ